MKMFKYLSIAAVVTLLLAPATAMAKTHFSVSLNLFQQMVPHLAPRAVILPPAPVYYVPQPVYQQSVVVREYYFPEQVIIHDITPPYYPPRPHPRFY